MLFRAKQDLSFFDSKQLYVENAEIIVTQKCNLACAHCMRGNSCNKEISDEVIDAFFDKFIEFGNLSIGGGEPSLAVERIRRVLEIAKEKNISVKALNVTTNAAVYNEDFAKVLLEWQDYVDYCLHEYPDGFGEGEFKISLRVSLDDFHIIEIRKKYGLSIEQILDNIKKYQEILGAENVRACYGADYELIDDGRASQYNGAVGKAKPITISKFPYFEGKEGVLVGGIVVVGVDGEIVPVNTPFENERVLSLGNVLIDKTSAIMKRAKLIRTDSIKQYNDKNFKVFQGLGIRSNAVKRYHKSKRFQKRLYIEHLLRKRGQVLKEDYETFDFTQGK